MSLTFPTSPTNGDTYTHGTRDFTWDGVAWVISASHQNTTKEYVDTVETAIISTTPPTVDSHTNSVQDGDLWYDRNGGRLYVFYNDGDSSQWVDASPIHAGNIDTVVAISATAPTLGLSGNPLLDGTLWYDTEGGRTYVWYNDGDTQQWIDNSPAFVDTEATFVSTMIIATDDADADSKTVAVGGLYAVAPATSSADIRVRLS